MRSGPTTDNVVGGVYEEGSEKKFYDHDVIENVIANGASLPLCEQ